MSAAGPICDGFWECLPLRATRFASLSSPLALLIALIVGIALQRGFGRNAFSLRVVARLVVLVSLLVFAFGFKLNFETLSSNRRHALENNRTVESLDFIPKGLRCRSDPDCRYEVGLSEVGLVDDTSPRSHPSIMLETGHAGAPEGRIKVWQLVAPDGIGPLCADVGPGAQGGIRWRIVTSVNCRLTSRTSQGIPIYSTMTSDPPTTGKQFTLVLEPALFVFDVFDPRSPGEAGYTDQVDRLLQSFHSIPLEDLRQPPPDSFLRMLIRAALLW